MEGEAGSSLQNAVTNRDTCAVCQGLGEEDHPRGKIIRRDEWRYEYIYIHYPNIVVLDQSARNGCQVCSHLVHAFKTDASFASIWDTASELERTRVGTFDINRDTAEAARLTKRYFANGIIVDQPTSRIVLKVTSQPADTPRNRSHIALGPYWGKLVFQHGDKYLGVSDECFVNIRADPIDPDPPTQDLLSDVHTSLVHRWMRGCDEKHEKCRLALGQSQKLPKRLLEISSNPATRAITKVRLIETTPSSKGIYACLSYCWGQSAQDYKTTRSNLHQYLESIPFNSLPGTIMDTLKLCCKLGFRYVWVDSLCIIQGDKEDWDREASNMAGIYGGSNLTLAIHLCEDSSESFLQKRQQPHHRVWGGNIARIAYTDELSQEKRLIYLWKRTEDQLKWTVGGNVNLMWGRSPWLDRAWTFQEWLLSPRVLHIQQITQWECLEGLGDEIQLRFPERDTVHRHANLLDKNWTWSSIIEEFTRRKIGKDEDRLPALAGLAKKYRDATGFEYLAGIWRQQLPGALLWHKEGPDYLKSPARYRAPSWSWASLEGAVYMPSDTDIDNGDPLCHWTVDLDQDTCSTEDIAQFKIYLFKIEGKRAIVLERTGQSGGKDTFIRRGRAHFTAASTVRDGHWEKKLIRLV